MEVGACDVEQFEFVSESQYYTQDQWDDKCFVCQAFAKDLEVLWRANANKQLFYLLFFLKYLLRAECN